MSGLEESLPQMIAFFNRKSDADMTANTTGSLSHVDARLYESHKKRLDTRRSSGRAGQQRSLRSLVLAVKATTIHDCCMLLLPSKGAQASVLFCPLLLQWSV